MMWPFRRKAGSSFTAESIVERNEELRPERLGPSEDDILRDDPFWKPPRAATADRWRPQSHL